MFLTYPKIDKTLKEKGVVGGLHLGEFFPDLGDCLLVCVTELHNKDKIDYMAACLEDAV